jgi:hypothetical protein
MSTLLICSQCGGVIGGSGANGRPCMCSRVSGSALKAPATAGDSSLSGSGGVAVQKQCCVCGIDVTNRKRMKDSHTGRYWCYDCGVANRSRTGSGMAMTCASCKKSFQPVHIVRSPKNPDVWVCQECAEAQSGKKKKESKHSDEGSALNGKSASKTSVVHAKAASAAAGTNRAVMVVGAIVVAGLAIVALHFGGIF